VGFEHDLRNAATVSEIDEDAAAVVAARRHPPEKHHRMPGIASAKRATVVGSFERGKEFGGRLGHAGNVNTNGFTVAWVCSRWVPCDANDIGLSSARRGCDGA
jgi:hypothetical protein